MRSTVTFYLHENNHEYCAGPKVPIMTAKHFIDTWQAKQFLVWQHNQSACSAYVIIAVTLEYDVFVSVCRNPAAITGSAMGRESLESST